MSVFLQTKVTCGKKTNVPIKTEDQSLVTRGKQKVKVSSKTKYQSLVTCGKKHEVNFNI